MLESEELLELLYKSIESKQSISKVLDDVTISNLPFHKCSEVRLLAAESLAFDCNGPLSEKILVQLAKDENPLIRVEAVDSLSAYFTKTSFDALVSALKDVNYLVRSYAAFGVAYVGKTLNPDSAISVLIEVKKKEKNPHVLSSCLEGLYILGLQSELINLIQLFQTDDYQLQCSILNELKEVLCKDNCEIIRAFITNTNVKSYPNSVKSSMQELSSMCHEMRI